MKNEASPIDDLVKLLALQIYRMTFKTAVPTGDCRFFILCAKFMKKVGNSLEIELD